MVVAHFHTLLIIIFSRGTRLDLSPYVAKAQAQHRNGGNPPSIPEDTGTIASSSAQSSSLAEVKESQPKPVFNSEGRSEALYDLYAVVNHHGGETNRSSYDLLTHSVVIILLCFSSWCRPLRCECEVHGWKMEVF
jgi:hypothetical protein